MNITYTSFGSLIQWDTVNVLERFLFWTTVTLRNDTFFFF